MSALPPSSGSGPAQLRGDARSVPVGFQDPSSRLYSNGDAWVSVGDFRQRFGNQHPTAYMAATRSYVQWCGRGDPFLEEVFQLAQNQISAHSSPSSMASSADPYGEGLRPPPGLRGPSAATMPVSSPDRSPPCSTWRPANYYVAQNRPSWESGRPVFKPEQLEARPPGFQHPSPIDGRNVALAMLQAAGEREPFRGPDGMPIRLPGGDNASPSDCGGNVIDPAYLSWLLFLHPGLYAFAPDQVTAHLYHGHQPKEVHRNLGLGAPRAPVALPLEPGCFHSLLPGNKRCDVCCNHAEETEFIRNLSDLKESLAKCSRRIVTAKRLPGTLQRLVPVFGTVAPERSGILTNLPSVLRGITASVAALGVEGGLHPDPVVRQVTAVLANNVNALVQCVDYLQRSIFALPSLHAREIEKRAHEYLLGSLTICYTNIPLENPSILVPVIKSGALRERIAQIKRGEDAAPNAAFEAQLGVMESADRS